LTVGRRIGHASDAVALHAYSHLFKNTDEDAANAIEAALRTGKERCSVFPGANPMPNRVSASRQGMRNDGDVAEWLKAAVC
jgi:hypothetical protein